MLTGRKFFQHDPCNHPVDESCDDAGEDHDGEIIHEIQIGEKQDGNDQLAEVVKDAAGHADTVDGEQAGFSCLFSFSVDLKEKCHGGKAPGGTGRGVEQAEDPGEQEASKENPDSIDQKCRMRIHPVQGKNNHKIGKP